MKKLAFAFMILLLAFTAAACGSSETSDTASKGKDASSDKRKSNISEKHMKSKRRLTKSPLQAA